MQKIKKLRRVKLYMKIRTIKTRNYFKIIAAVLTINLFLLFPLSACGSSLVKVSEPYMSFMQCYRAGCPVVCIDFTNKTDDWIEITGVTCEYDGKVIGGQDIYIEAYSTRGYEFRFRGMEFSWDGESDNMSVALSKIGKITWKASKAERPNYL